MTENTPDAVKVAREAVAAQPRLQRYPDLREIAAEIRAGKCDERDDVSMAILGARAMQAAMPAPAGVRVPDDALIACVQRLTARGEALVGWMQFSPEAASDLERWRAAQAEAWVRFASRPPAIEDAGAREGAAEPLTMPVAHDPRFPSSGGTTKTIDGALYNAPTPAGAGNLVERLRWGIPEKSAVAGGGHVYDFNALHTLMTEAASRIEALEAEVARLRQAVRNDTATIGQYEEHRQKLHAARSAAEARATTAEADLAALRAEVERKDKALRAYQQIADAEGWGDRPGDHPMRGAARHHGAVALAPAKAGG